MNLLVTGAWQDAKENISTLEEMGHSVQFLQYEKDDPPCDYGWVEGIIGNGIFVYHHIDKFPKLKFIQLTSAGFDRIPLEYVRKQGIEIHNARGVYSIPMAEFAVAGVLQIYKQSRFFYENQREHKWVKHRGVVELFGKKVCMIGCGNVGQECARRFRAFGCSVVGADPYVSYHELFDRMVGMDFLDEAIGESDVLVLTLPLTEDTRHMMDARRLEFMKSGSVLVNISRGAIVDTKALVERLIGGGLLGAVLDVFEEEPLDTDSRLWNMENVILTPHNSFVGEGNAERLNKVIYDNLLRM